MTSHHLDWAGDGDSSLEVNWCEVTIINKKTQEIIYQNNWITNHEINDNNVDKIVKAGRSRCNCSITTEGDRGRKEIEKQRRTAPHRSVPRESELARVANYFSKRL